LIESLYGYPYLRRTLKLLSFYDKTKEHFFVKGDGEIYLYGDGRLILIYETDIDLPARFTKKRWSVRMYGTDNTYDFTGLELITKTRSPFNNNTIQVYLCKQLEINYLPKQEQVGFDYMWQGLYNFEFGKVKTDSIRMRHEDNRITAFEYDGYLPKFVFQLNGVKVAYRLINHWLYWASFGDKSISPGLGAELGFKINAKINEDIARILTYMTMIASANIIRIPYRKIYKNGSLAREIINSTDNELFNPHPIIKHNIRNVRRFFIETGPTFVNLYNRTMNSRYFDIARWTENVVYSFLGKTPLIRLLHMGIAMEEMTRYFRLVIKKERGRKSLDKQIEEAVNYYSLSDILVKLAYIRDDFAHSFNVYLKKSKYDLHKDPLPLENEFRKFVCKFIGFTGKTYAREP